MLLDYNLNILIIVGILYIAVLLCISIRRFFKESSMYRALKFDSTETYARIALGEDSVRINSSGDKSVICCAGDACWVKAKLGSWITLSEWATIDGERIPVCVKTEYVDGKRIKEDTKYALMGGEFVEVLALKTKEGKLYD